ncbi:MAG: hypothetical protein KC547_01695 [Anaerolineae bacterium]|nr:hypothetical protein [Anaerolineae bacterium]
MEKQHLHKLVESIFTVHADENEIDCEGCGCQIDHLAELVAAGANLRELLPAVEAHLRCCTDCREEFEALVAIIRSQDTESPLV